MRLRSTLPVLLAGTQNFPVARSYAKIVECYRTRRAGQRDWFEFIIRADWGPALRSPVRVVQTRHRHAMVLSFINLTSDSPFAFRVKCVVNDKFALENLVIA